MSNSSKGTAEVQRLLDMVGYQDGTVVSRQILKRKTGNVTLFAFASGEGLSEHTAPFEAWIFVPEGEAEVRVGTTDYALAAGDCLVLPANVPHAVSAKSDFKMLLVMIRE